MVSLFMADAIEILRPRYTVQQQESHLKPGQGDDPFDVAKGPADPLPFVDSFEVRFG